MRSEPYMPKCTKCEGGLHEIKYKYQSKTLISKYSFPDGDAFLFWAKLHGEPYEEYEILEMICCEQL